MRVKCITETGETVVSEYKEIEFGTPQGSVLGPLIFLIFNNDLHLHLAYSNCILFVDDTTLYCTPKDLRHLTWCIMEDLQTISDWFRANKLTLNLDKSVCMLFQNKHGKSMNPYLQELGLPVVTNTKFLGVRIDEKLDWDYQLNHVLIKLKRNIGLLKRSVNFLNVHAKKNLYYVHIFSHLNYCIGTWGPMLTATKIKKLQKLQNKCIILIITKRMDLHRKFHELKILKVSEIIELELIKTGFKLIKCDLPANILIAMKTDHQQKSLQKTHPYSTRYKSTPNRPKVTGNKYLNSFLCKALAAIEPLLFITRSFNITSQMARHYKSRVFATGDNT